MSNWFKLKSILTEQQVALSIKRLAHQVLENHLDLEHTVFIGMQPRGIFLSDRIVDELRKLSAPRKIAYGKLDITFYRDDVRREIKFANKTDIPFSIENKNVVIMISIVFDFSQIFEELVSESQLQ